MKIEKKLVTLGILAFAIGIATILPLSYITIRANSTNQTQPFFTPYVMTVQVIPDEATLYSEPYMIEHRADGTVYYSDIPNEASIDTTICFHITPYGADLKGVDAKIEVYNIQFYSKQGSILNITQIVGVVGNVPDPNSPNDVITAITGSSGYAHYDNPTGWANHKDTLTFADGTVYDVTNLLSYTESRSIVYQTVEYYTKTEEAHSVTGGMAVLSLTKGERSAQALEDLRNAQTIYVDITRVMQITYKHPNSTNESSIITATPTTTIKEVLYHIQLPAPDRLGRVIYKTDHDGYQNQYPEWVYGKPTT